MGPGCWTAVNVTKKLNRKVLFSSAQIRFGTFKEHNEKTGGAIPRTMLITRKLFMLPTKYDYCRSTWDFAESSKGTFKNIKARLLIKELHLQNQ